MDFPCVDDVDQQTTNCLVLKVMGGTYDPHQANIKALREKKDNVCDVDIRITPEPHNIVDKNALLIEVLMNDNEWAPIGYIGVEHIKRVKASIDKQEITSIRVKDIKRKFTPIVQTFVYTCYITIVKHGSWKPKDFKASYNSMSI